MVLPGKVAKQCAVKVGSVSQKGKVGYLKIRDVKKWGIENYRKKECSPGECGDLLSVESSREYLVGHKEEAMGRGRETRKNQQSTRKLEERTEVDK
jgi:hypothetical protein